MSPCKRFAGCVHVLCCIVWCVFIYVCLVPIECYFMQPSRHEKLDSHDQYVYSYANVILCTFNAGNVVFGSLCPF